jgi:hypothetical protein
MGFLSSPLIRTSQAEVYCYPTIPPVDRSPCPVSLGTLSKLHSSQNRMFICGHKAFASTLATDYMCMKMNSPDKITTLLHSLITKYKLCKLLAGPHT